MSKLYLVVLGLALGISLLRPQRLSSAERTPAVPLATTPPNVWTASGKANASAWGDIDGDGRLDLVVAGDGLSLYRTVDGLPETDPSWQSNPIVPNQNDARAVALGDLDQDGDLDVVCAYSSPLAPDAVYRNDGGTLTLDPVWTSGDSLRSQAVVLADMDNDGDLDLVFSNARLTGDSRSPKQIYRNDDGIITRAPVWESEAVENGRGIAVGDLNQDGYLDLASADFGGATADTVQFFGASVSSAGDFNADGYDDLITASDWWNGGVKSTRVYIFFGGPGADSVADMILHPGSSDDFAASLTEHPGMIGVSVAGVGDVNGDGFDDVVVGARWATVNGTTSGRAYVYFGGSPPDTVPDLVIDAEAPFDQFGFAVSGAGDVNGDGFGDFLVGAPHRDFTATGAGRTYVYFGGSSPDAVPDLVIDGEAQADNLGHAVARAGDVNGDGFGDFLIGAYRHDGAGNDAGRAYLYLGGSTPDALPDLVIDGEAAGDSLGDAIAPAGDVNGDGFGDFLIGASRHDGTGNDAGRVYLYLGGSTPDTTPDLVIDGEAAGDFLGYAVAPAGDVNGDGFGDFLIGAPMHGDVWPDLGRAYLYLGGSAPDAQPDLVVDGDQAGARLAAIDNFNGDGFSDFAVDVVADDVGGPDAGSVFVLYGGASPDGQPDLILRGPDGAVWHGGGGSVYLSDQGTLPVTPTWRSGPTDFNEGVALGDVDGDGDLDLVFSGFSGSTVTDPAEYTLFRNNVASIDTAPAWSALVPGESYDLELGDLDQNGKLDLVTVGFDGVSGFGQIFGNQNGVFTPQPVDLIPDLGTGSVHDVSLADFDGDGDVDIAEAGPEGAALLRNDQQNWFSADSTWSTTDMAQTNGVALGDLDGDGDLDIVFANQGQQQAYFNQGGSVNRAPDWVSSHSWVATDVAVRDLDRDGFPEVVFATDYQQPFLVYDNPGVLATVPWESQDRPLTLAIDLGDVNLDGKPDLVGGNATFNFSCSDASIPDAVYRGSSGRFDIKPTWQSGPPYGQTHGVAVVDLDGDLDPDLVCANFCNQSNTVRLNNEGTLSSGPDWTSTETAISWDVKVADVDGDGLLDLIYARDTDMAVYQNLGGSAQFALRQVFGSSGARSIALGDVNADGRPDIVFGVWGRNGLYLNQGESFGPDPVWTSSLSWGTNMVALGDIDQDGDLDLVCGNNGFNNLGQKNTIYDGLRNPAYRGDPEHPTNQLPQNGVILRGLTFQSTSLTTYRVRFQLADVESDPVWIYPEYRIPPARAWSPMLFTGQTGKVGLLASSPQGTSHEFEWNTADVPLTLGDIEVRIRWTPIPGSSVGLVRKSGVYLYDLPTPPARPVIDLPQSITFPGVTIGDTASVNLPVGNAGTDVMIVNDIQFSDGTMQTAHPRNFPVGAAKSENVPIVLVPDTVGTAGKSLTVTTSDPLHPESTVDVQIEVLPLDARVQVLSPTPAPLGEALTVLVSPITHVESGDLVFRLDQAVGNFAAGDHAVSLIPVGGEFIGIVPAEAVTELGVRYYIRLANGGFTRDLPAGAPNAPYFQSVAAPEEMSVQAQPNAGSGYLEGLGISVQALLQQGAVFDTGTLYYRRGGESGYRAQPLSLAGLLPAAVIPDTLVDDRGIEYYVDVETAGGARLTAPQADPAEAPYALQVTVLDAAEPETHPGGKYRMVSLPFDFGPQFTGTLEALLSDQPEFRSYDPKRWRAFRYLPSSGTYLELSDESAASEFTPKPGRSYWLISKAPHRVDTKPISSQSTRTDAPAKVVLAPGWNQIGDPYAFPVSWDSVRVDGRSVATSNVGSPVFWNGDTYQLDRPTLLPYEGYWVFNGGEGPAVLEVPAVEAGAPATGPRRRAAPLGQDASGWEVRISAVSAGARDDANVAGVKPGAAVERDPFDRVDPPTVPGRGISVEFPHEAWAEGAGPYTVDVRPPLGAGVGGYAWAFDIAKTFSDEESGDLTTLAFDVGAVPANLQVFLLDRRFDRLMDLRQEDAYTCTVGKRPTVSAAEDARFELLVGDETFIRDRKAGVEAVSFRNRLFQNYPNPFRSDTMIRYEVAERAPVRIQVFDAQGRLVRSLVDSDVEAGRYETRWNGRDDQGRETGPGIYFFRLTSSRLQETRRMVLIR